MFVDVAFVCVCVCVCGCGVVCMWCVGVVCVCGMWCVCVWVWCVYVMCVWCMGVVCVCGMWCVCVCGCGVCMWCGVGVVFFINIYLQHVPLHGNTTCSSVHVIHCLSFWSVFGTTCGDVFRTMTNYQSV